MAHLTDSGHIETYTTEITLTQLGVTLKLVTLEVPGEGVRTDAIDFAKQMVATFASAEVQSFSLRVIGQPEPD